VYDPRLKRASLKLDLRETRLGPAALSLDRFAQINDAMIARCGCDARTEIGIGSGGLPAYVVRLDPETQRSEVLILLSGENLGSPVATANAAPREPEPCTSISRLYTACADETQPPSVQSSLAAH